MTVSSSRKEYMRQYRLANKEKIAKQDKGRVRLRIRRLEGRDCISRKQHDLHLVIG